ncbi:MFS transporter [Sphingomonas sp. Mn802worker]|uniref:MFS transporter n=1 Tax=Sphingomonas sp. Mn802worker TaxID=629773 RepID=UPI00036A30FD|nr:MFS transporter [Sphingomonas sp. Mn802worker]
MDADATIEMRTMRKVTWRLLPFLMLCYLLAFIDRANVGMASLQMNADLGLSSRVFGFGASLFFVAYFLMEVPSNLMLQKVGARYWIARIMVTWGLVSAAMAFVWDAPSFYVMRFLLGAAEAGFFPGVVLYLTYWMPPRYRGRTLALFAVAIPLSSFVGSPLSGLLLSMNGLVGLRGWQWLFICEGVPTVLLGLTCLKVLTDRPADAAWLTDAERAWLTNALAPAAGQKPMVNGSIWQLARTPAFWAMVIACSGASAAGSVLGVWQPQLLKSFGLTDLQTGLVNSVPYGIAALAMVLWGRHSDATDERRWHTALPLLLIAVGAIGTFALTGLLPTLLLLTFVLAGAYCFKGPFWSMASSWLSTGTAAAGIAAINATSNLIGGGLMVNVYGVVHDATGSYVLALLPLAGLTVASAVAVVLVGRAAAETSKSKAPAF